MSGQRRIAPKLFFVKRQSESNEVCVRDLEAGMSVPVGGETFIISKVSWMDGRNGDPPLMITVGKSAVAKKIEFLGREPIIAHPSIVVTRK